MKSESLDSKDKQHFEPPFMALSRIRPHLRKKQDEILKMMARRCSDQNEDIRAMTAEGLSYLARRLPKKKDKVFELFERLCQDHSPDVRWCAFKGYSFLDGRYLIRKRRQSEIWGRKDRRTAMPRSER